MTALILLLGLLVGGLAFVPSGSSVIPSVWVGSVTDGSNPVVGARVRFKGDSSAVLTDEEGRFRLHPSKTGAGRLTAWKEGYLIGGTRSDALPLEIRLKPIPLEDCERYSWVDPTPDARRSGNCGNCHQEIYDEWKASGHARSATGRHFRNLLEGTDWNGQEGIGWSLAAEHPLGAGVCASCHAPTEPMAAVESNAAGSRGVATHGVHCDYCHKINNLGDGTIGLTHGRFNLDLRRPVEGQLFLGPLNDVDRGEDAYSPFYKDSKYCASCHEGVVFGVHVYSTYSEWRDSPAAREGLQCQSCHMKPTGRMTNLAPGKGGIAREPKTLGNHRFFAGSQSAMLKECLHLDVQTSHDHGDLRVEVEVRAEGVGHRVPTGFVDRHLLLVVEGFDADKNPIRARAGPTLPEFAGLGLSGKSGNLYAKLLKDFDGHTPAPFWRADPDFEDTRLTPGQPDRMIFAFPSSVRQVKARLIYRKFWQEVAQTKKWPDEDLLVVEETKD